jgi:hypothetical protein
LQIAFCKRCLNLFISLQMAASEHFRALTELARSFLRQHPELLPGMTLAVVAAHGGLDGFAQFLGIEDDWDQYIYMVAFYLECHRLCDLGRGWVPYQPILPPQ